MLPGPSYSEARLKARYHIQAAFTASEVAQTPEHFPVIGRAVRVFRGDGSLVLGDEIRFSLPVFRPADDLPDGGDFWTPLSRYQAATHIEAFMDGRPPCLTLANSQYELINGPTDLPQMDVPTQRSLDEEWRTFYARIRS